MSAVMYCEPSLFDEAVRMTAVRQSANPPAQVERKTHADLLPDRPRRFRIEFIPKPSFEEDAERWDGLS